MARKSALLLTLILLAFFIWYYNNALFKQETTVNVIEETLSQPEKGKLIPPSPHDMALIKGGCFKMGNFFENGGSDELPVHEVCVDDFYIGKHEVTVGAFREFFEEIDYITDAERDEKGWVLNETGDSWEEQEGINWRNPGFEQDDRHPVTMVSWNDAVAYISWLNKKSGKTYRLPSEAEWEFAARDGGKLIEYSWGNEWPDGNIAGDELGNHFPRRPWPVWEDYDDSFVFTSPVGSFKPNSFGLYDMSGNVWEWCADWYDGDYYANSPINNPEGPIAGTHRVRRGGSWFSVPQNLRTGIRDTGTPDERDFYLGFRLARNAKAKNVIQ